METMPVALSLPTVPIVRPIIGTNTYRQVCQTGDVAAEGFKREILVTLPSLLLFKGSVFSLQVQQTLEARAASFVGPPPAFVAPGEHYFCTIVFSGTNACSLIGVCKASYCHFLSTRVLKTILLICPSSLQENENNFLYNNLSSAQ